MASLNSLQAGGYNPCEPDYDFEIASPMEMWFEDECAKAHEMTNQEVVTMLELAKELGDDSLEEVYGLELEARKFNTYRNNL